MTTLMPDVRVEIGDGSRVTDSVVKWRDVTSLATSIKAKRGRNYELDEIEAGTATIEFDNSATEISLADLTPRHPIRAYGIADDNWLPAACVIAPVEGALPAPRWQQTTDNSVTWNDAEAGTIAGVLDAGRMAHRFAGGAAVKYRSGLAGDSDVIHVTSGQTVTVSADMRNAGTGADCYLGCAYENYEQTAATEIILNDPISPGAGWVTVSMTGTAPYDGILRLLIVAPVDALVTSAKVRLDGIGSENAAELSGVFPLIRGYVERWTQGYGGLLSTVTADCVDESALLSRPIPSAYRMAVNGWATAHAIPKSPVVDSSTGADGTAVPRLWYWPCVESSDTTTTYPEYGTTVPLRMRDCVTPAPDDGASGFTPAKTMVHADGTTSGSFVNKPDSQLVGSVLELCRNGSPAIGACQTLTVDLWYLPESLGHDQTLWSARTSAGGVHSSVEVDTSGTVIVETSTGPSGILRAYSDAGVVQPGQVVHIGARMGIGSVAQNPFAEVWIDGTQHDYFEFPTPGTYSSPTIGGAAVAGRWRTIAPIGYAAPPRGAVNHVIVGMDIQEGVHQALDGVGWDQHSESEADRIRRLLDGVGWRGARSVDAPLSILLSPRWHNDADGWRTAVDAAADAGGVLLMGAAGEATYHSRRRRIGAPVRWALAEWTPGVRYLVDDTHIYNRISAERSTGLRRTAEDQQSIDSVGVKPLLIRRDVTSPDEVSDAAAWTLRRYRDAAPRCDTLRVEAHGLTGGTDGPQRLMVVAADISDRLTAATPPGAPTPQLDCFIEGINVTLKRNGAMWYWVTEFAVSDAARSDGWVLEGPSGHLGAAACVTVY